VLAVTTFPPNAWNVYARNCLQRMAKLWPGSIRAYFEGHAPPAIEGVEFRPLDMPERQQFLDRPIEKRPGFLWDAKRFCHKVFAQLDAAKDGEPFWWIDADVAIFRKVPRELLEQTELVTYLGRDSYTETGLIGFNPKHPEWKEFARRYRNLYTDGGLLALDQWTDCHAFDRAREGRGENLTPNGRGFENVMADSKFGSYMAHFKGPLKARLYQLGGDDESLSAGV
jgi:hypothetical protein